MGLLESQSALWLALQVERFLFIERFIEDFNETGKRYSKWRKEFPWSSYKV